MWKTYTDVILFRLSAFRDVKCVKWNSLNNTRWGSKLNMRKLSCQEPVIEKSLTENSDEKDYIFLFHFHYLIIIIMFL